jgi:SpoVK/Ycf46/Vps4 family AAA+-type ATPase
VVFFDEMDALARTREKAKSDKNKSPLDMTSLLLTTSMLPKLADLWKKARVIFLMATNHRQNLDPAIIRANRFDLLLCVGPPRWSKKKSADKLQRVFKVAKDDKEKVENRLDELVVKGSETERLLDLFTVPELGVFFEYLRRSGSDRSLLSALKMYGTAAEFSTAVKKWAKSGIALREKSTLEEYDADFGASRRQYSSEEEEGGPAPQKQNPVISEAKDPASIGPVKKKKKS